VTSLFGILRTATFITLAGLAILPSFQDAIERPLVAPCALAHWCRSLVAATPLPCWHHSAFWALVAGVISALVTDRAQLMTHWNGEHTAPSDAGSAGGHDPSEGHCPRGG